VSDIYKGYEIKSQPSKKNKLQTIFVVWDRKGKGIANNRQCRPYVASSLKKAKVWIDRHPQGLRCV